MQAILQEIRHALRQFRDSPGFSVAAVLMLASGITATTATFSVVEGVLLRPLPFPGPSRLVSLGDIFQGGDSGSSSFVAVTAAEIRAYIRDTHSFESLGGYSSTTYELSGAGEPVQVNACQVNPGVFSALGVMPFLGRVFTQKEDDDKQQLAVLSYSFWRNRLHGDPHVLGTQIHLDRKPYVVIGVMPRNFEFPLYPGHLNHSELWVPVSQADAELATDSGSWGYQMVGRLRTGVTLAQANADAERVAQEIMRNFPASFASIHIDVVVRPLQEDTVGQARPLIRILFLAVSVVLLIACANLAGLLLVRAIRRRREMAVRLALGASGVALLRQTMLESLVLSVTGGVLGIGLAALAIRVSISRLPETLPRISEIGLNWIVVAFALLLAVATGILCSSAPAFATMRTDLNASLKEGGPSGSAGASHARLRSTLIVVEIAIALVLAAASGLLLRSFEKMRAVALGFSPEHVLVASYALPQQQYSSQAVVNEFNHELLRRLDALPGVQSGGLSSVLPMSNSLGLSVFVPEGYIAPKGPNMSAAGTSATVGNFYSAMRIRLLHGRFFTDSDNADAPLVVVVNHKLAQHYWPGQDPIGKRLRFGTPELKTPWLTIVGEVADVKQDSPDVDTRELYYQPLEQSHLSLGELSGPTDVFGAGYIVLRTTLPPEQMQNSLRSTVRSLDPQLALAQVQTMEQAVSDTEAPRRFNTAVVSAFAAAAVLLAALGIYSIIAFSVELRVREIAIRMALGSQRIAIVRLILLSAIRLMALGCVLGLLGALAAYRLINSLLFQVSPFDPLVLTLAAVAILALVMAASAPPAIQAASVDPMNTLRAE